MMKDENDRCSLTDAYTDRAPREGVPHKKSLQIGCSKFDKSPQGLSNILSIV